MPRRMSGIVILAALILSAAGSTRAEIVTVASKQYDYPIPVDELYVILHVSAVAPFFRNPSGDNYLADHIYCKKGTVLTLTLEYADIPVSWEVGSEVSSALVKVNGTSLGGPSGSFTTTVEDPGFGDEHQLMAEVVYKQVSGSKTYDWKGQAKIDVRAPLLGMQVRSDYAATRGPSWRAPLPNPATFASNDLFNLNYDVYIYAPAQYIPVQESAATTLCAGVETRVFYYNTESQATPLEATASAWTLTGADGHALCQMGDGGGGQQALSCDYFARKLFVYVNRGGYVVNFLTPEGYSNIKGKLTAKVMDFENRPLSGALVALHGGPLPYYNDAGVEYVSQWTGENGTTPFTFTTGDVTQDLDVEVHLPPAVLITPKTTQFVDEPFALIRDATAYVSPEAYYSSEAFTYYDKKEYFKNVTFKLCDANDPKNVFATIGPREVLPNLDTGDALYNRKKLYGGHRVYFPVTPTAAGCAYKIQATVPNKDKDAIEKDLVIGQTSLGTNVKATREPKKGQYHFHFVVCKVGAWASVGAKMTTFVTMPPAWRNEQAKFLTDFIPVPVTFSDNLNWSPAVGATTIFSFNSTHLNQLATELEKYKATMPDVDVVIGVIPPGYLHTHSMFSSGGAAGLSYPKIKGVALLDPTRTMPHHTLHETLHTLGFDDYYTQWSWSLMQKTEPPSADGYCSRYSSVCNLVTMPSSYPQFQRIMYDSAVTSFYEWNEYGSILQETTKVIGASPSPTPSPAPPPFHGASSLADASSTKVLVLTGRVFEYGPYSGKAEFDPIILADGEPYMPSDTFTGGDGGWYVRVLGDADAVLGVAKIKKLDEGTTVPGNSNGAHWVPDLATNFFYQFPWSEGIRKIEAGQYRWKDIYAPWGTVLVSPHAPSVTWLGPAPGDLSGLIELSWQASDPDGGALNAYVFASADAGAHWTPLISNVTTDTAGGVFHYAFQAEYLETGDQYKFKVLVTDGVRSGETVAPGVYRIAGHVAGPAVARLLRNSFATTATAPACLTAPLPVANDGESDLGASVDVLALPSWLRLDATSPVLTLLPGERRVLPFVIAAPTSGTYETTVTLHTSDTTHPLFLVPVRVIVNDDAPATPLIDWIETNAPSDGAEWGLTPGTGIRFRAYEAGGLTGLATTVTIQRIRPTTETMVDAAPMAPAPEPGQYLFDWLPTTDTAAGVYAVEVNMRATTTGLADTNGWIAGDWDLRFNLRAPNNLPEFTAPAYEENGGYAPLGSDLVLPFHVSDPDGDRIDLSVHRFPYPVRIDPIAGEIRWTPTLEQLQSAPVVQYGSAKYWELWLELAATDEHRAMKMVRWYIWIYDSRTDAPKAFASNLSDGEVLTSGVIQLIAECFVSGQQGCRFEYRLAGSSTWIFLGQVAWQPYGDHWRAAFDWDTTGLPAGAEIEVRFVNVNGAGQPDSNPTVFRVYTPGDGGSLIKVLGRKHALAGDEISFQLYALNLSEETWTIDSDVGPRPVLADPFTSATQLELAPLTQIAPGATGPYILSGRAPATPGTYTGRWRLYSGGRGGWFGNPIDVTLEVHADPEITSAALLNHLLGNAGAAADLNGDGRVDVADLLILLDLAR